MPSSGASGDGIGVDGVEGVAEVYGQRGFRVDDQVGPISGGQLAGEGGVVGGGPGLAVDLPLAVLWYIALDDADLDGGIAALCCSVEAVQAP